MRRTETSNTAPRMPLAVAAKAIPVPVRNAALAFLSGVLVALPFLHPQFFAAGWIGFVPLLFALRQASLPAAWLLGTVAGFTAWASAHYWMPQLLTIFLGHSPAGSLAAGLIYWLYVSQSVALAALLFRWLEQRTDGPVVLLFPVTFVMVFGLYPLLTPITLAAGQTGFLPGIQGADLIGGRGVDLMLVLTSATVFQGSRDGLACWRWPATAASMVLLLTWFGYGTAATIHWQSATAAWSERTVGIVQPDDAPSVGISPVADGYTRLDPPEMEMTRALAADGADLVVWPETRFKGYHRYQSVRRAYQRQVRTLATPLIFQDSEGTEADAYNSSVVLDADGIEVAHYRKIRRMPFGEYIPMIEQFPVLEPLARAYIGDASSELTAGTHHASAMIGGMRVVPKICFETAIPVLIAEAVAQQPAGTVLVYQSMNNWFGETLQPYQHARQAILRGIENRVPVVHAMNNGPSTVSGPDGRVIATTEAFTQTAVAMPLPHDPQSGGSLYSRYPRAFLFTLYGAQAILIIIAVVRGRSRSAAISG